MPATRIVVARDLDEVTPHVDAWSRLQAAALEPNVFLTPAFLLPLIRHRGEERPYRLVFAYDAGDDLIACAAFAEPAPLTPVGPTALGTWDHPHFLDATPLLCRHRAAAAAAALADWLDRSEHPWSMIRWDRLALASRTWDHLEAVARERGRGSWTRHAYQRAEMRCRESFDEFLSELSSKRRGKLRWRMNRLDKEGDLGIVLHRDLADPGIVDRFLELEAAGWKGEAGTALACDPADEAFFREASEKLAAAGGLFFLELTLDGHPVAITANFRHRGTVHLVKSAYDPERGKLSPGIVNLLHLTRLAHEEPDVDRLDSCATEGSHLEQVWRGSFRFGEVLVATGALSSLAVTSLPWLRESRDAVSRAAAKVGLGAA